MDYSKIKAVWWSGTCYHKEQLNEVISSSDVEEYAWILHDKDTQPDNPTELKKPHYHFLVHLKGQQRGSWFKAFASEDMGIVFVQPCRSPQGAFDYLIHDTAHARKEGKFLYPESERISTITKLDTTVEELDESTEVFTDIVAILDNQMNWHDFYKKKPKRIYSCRSFESVYNVLYREKYGKPPNENDYIKKPPVYERVRKNENDREPLRPYKKPLTKTQLAMIPLTTDEDDPF